MKIRSDRRWPLPLAAAIVVVLPTAAFLAAPATAADRAGAPGSGLAGINTSATAAGTELAFLTPGIVPIGDSARGDVVQAQVPYANSTISTGPSTAGTASPVWPGTAAANAGNALATFVPTLPAALVKALNDPVVARSAYPSQVEVGSSNHFSEPGVGEVGVGTASSTSGGGSTSAQSAITDTSPLGVVPGSSSLVKKLTPVLKSVLGILSKKGSPLAGAVSGSQLLDVGSATTRTTATLGAATVGTSAHTRISHVTIAGVINIDGISSDATANSNGKVGTESSSSKVGAVTVAGLPASIGPKGITLDKKGLLGQTNAIAVANQLLTALNQVGLSITAIAPVTQKKGGSASVTSGGVQISFRDPNVPNVGALLPVPAPLPNSLGIDLNLGLSNAQAAATALPPTVPPVTPTSPTTLPSQPTTGTVSGGGLSNSGSTGPAVGLPSGGGVTSGGGSGGPSPIVAEPAAAQIMGVPVRVAWVVMALLGSFVAAGLLLGYANWQLLRGRTS